MQGLNQADPLYKPTVYWKTYEQYFLPEIKKYGLHDFRRRKNSILASFGGVDLLIKGKIDPPIQFKGSGILSRFWEGIVVNNPLLPLNTLTTGSPEWVTQYFYFQVQRKFEQVNLDLARCPTSLIGNPEDVQEINNQNYSLSHLNYCAMVADAALHIPLRDDMVICELGAGMGRNIEIFAKLFPHATLIIFDIPPQLYVSNQYLKAVFGDRVIGYDQALKLTVNPNQGVRDAIKGKIVMLPTWVMSQWRKVKIDLFWNCASFQEMEPSVVKNYLGIVKDMAPQYIYINAIPEGNFQGTKEPILSSYYTDSLCGNYQLSKQYKTDYFLRKKDYDSYVFSRKQSS